MSVKISSIEIDSLDINVKFEEPLSYTKMWEHVLSILYTMEPDDMLDSKLTMHMEDGKEETADLFFVRETRAYLEHDQKPLFFSETVY